MHPQGLVDEGLGTKGDAPDYLVPQLFTLLASNHIVVSTFMTDETLPVSGWTHEARKDGVQVSAIDRLQCMEDMLDNYKGTY
jgi:hypothetical protein